MKSFYLLMGAMIALCNLSLAQTTVTTAYLIPELGDSIYLNRFQYSPADPTGGMQVWDYATAVPTSTTLTRVVDPSTTTYSANFPGADLAYTDPNEGTEYSQVTDSTYIRLGVFDATANVLIDYTVPEILMEFPLQYQDTFRNEFSGQFMSAGSNYHRTGFTRGEYDAYGTLILPWGTLTDVARIHVVSTTVDSTNIGGFPFFINTTIDSYIWIKEGNDFQLLGIYSIDSGLGSTIDYAVYQSEPSYATGITEGMLQGASLSVYPNPVEDQLSVKLGLEEAQEAEIVIENQMGQVVKRLDQNHFGFGSHEMHYSVSDLSAGVYFLRIQSDAGSIQQKIVKR